MQWSTALNPKFSDMPLPQLYVTKCIIWSDFSTCALVYSKYCTVRPHEAVEHLLTKGKITPVCTNDSHSKIQDQNNGNFLLHSFLKTMLSTQTLKPP